MSAVPTALPSGSRGFTLVEMLMAMLIMTVGLLGLLQSVNVAYQQSVRDKLRKEATLVAEARMHDWCRLPFGSITSTTPEPKVDAGKKLVAGTLWRFKVSRGLDGVGSITKKLQVAVTWSVNGASDSSHEIFTLRSRRDGE